MDSMQGLMSLAERFNAGLEATQEEEDRLRRELDLLQSYSELVRGMSGYVGGLLLLAGVPDQEVIAAAHSEGSAGGSDMAPLFPEQKSLCSFVPSSFSGGRGGGRGERHEDVSDHMDITSPSLSSRLAREGSGQQKQPSRGRQSSSDRDRDHDYLRGSSRLSRSLSPNNARHHTTTSLALQGEVHRATSARQLPLQQRPRVHAQQHSLVSDILTMFAGHDKERLHDTTTEGDPSNGQMYVEGSVLIRNARNLSEDMCSYARGGGGLRVWYPLLLMDAPRQVATLRILASLITTSAQVRTQFEALSVSSVLLYSMYVTPLLASEASLQVLFDLATAPPQPHSLMQQSKHEAMHIHRVEFLRLSVQIATSSPCNIQLSLCTLEWLIGCCDDSLENIAKVLEAVGLVPFLLMLSLWFKCEDMQLAENNEGGQGAEDTRVPDDISEYTVRMPCATLTVDEKDRLMTSSRRVFVNDSIYSDQPKKLAKLQITIARFLKLLITGVNGELPPLRVAAAAQTPSGFGVPHLQALLHFIAHTLE